MLPEFIYREEQTENPFALVALGSLSGFLGFGFARVLFQARPGVLAVAFASIPLAYPLLRYFFEAEEEDRPFLDELGVYLSVFTGLVVSFTFVEMWFPGAMSVQASALPTGNATAPGLFAGILENNLRVFAAILAVASFIGSAGAVILTWNASVMGVFFGSKMADGLLLSSCAANPGPLCFVPHAVFEMGGFITAGIAGSLISASIYRGHTSTRHVIDLGLVVALGLLLVLTGAALEGLGAVAFFLCLVPTSAVGAALYRRNHPERFKQSAEPN
jgi:uncharacterized membrane protein SpoIIM required for sporulation